MYTLQIPEDTAYSVTGTLPGIMEQLANELLVSRRQTDGLMEYLEAVWPTDPGEVDEDTEIPAPVEVNEDTVQEFAAKVWGVPIQTIELAEEARALTHGEFHAMMHHLGLGHATLGEMLGGVAAKTISRWISGKEGKKMIKPVPVRVTSEMEELLDRHDTDVEKICEMYDRGVTIIYPYDESQQQLDSVPLGWELRVLQRATVEHGITVHHLDEQASGIDYFEAQ